MVEKRYEYGRVPRPQIETMAPDRSSFLGTGIMGLSDFISDIFTPARREIIEEPKVDFFTAKEYQQINPSFFADSVVDPNETIAVQQSAGVYGEPEFGFEYMPAARFASDAVDYVKSFVTDEKTRDAAAQTAARIPGIVADELGKQKKSVAVGRTVYDPETGSTTTFDPLVAGVGTLATARLISGMPDNAVGVMGGSKAVGYFEKRNDYFQSLSDDRAKGKDADEVKAYNESGGGFKDPLSEDSAFRFLIDSRKAKLKPEFIVDFEPTNPNLPKTRSVGNKTELDELETYDTPEKARERAGFSLTNLLVLEDVLDFPELYKRYPTLKNYSVERLSAHTGAKASFNEITKTIKLKAFEAGDEDDAVSSLLHEVQHAIDDIEGVDPGSSSSLFKPFMFEEMKQGYKEKLSKANDAVEKAKIGPTFQVRELYELFKNKPTGEGVLYGDEALPGALKILPEDERTNDVLKNLQKAYENIKNNPELEARINAGIPDGAVLVGDGAESGILQVKYYRIMQDLFGKDTEASLSSKTDDRTDKQNIVKEVFEVNSRLDQLDEIEYEAFDKYYKTKGEINARAAEDFFNSTELQDFYPDILMRKAQERPTGGRLFPADATFDDIMRGIIRKDEIDSLEGLSKGGEVKKGIGSMAREVL